MMEKVVKGISDTAALCGCTAAPPVASRSALLLSAAESASHATAVADVRATLNTAGF